MSSSGVSSTARKREGWNFKCALTFRYNQAPPAIAYIQCLKTHTMKTTLPPFQSQNLQTWRQTITQELNATREHIASLELTTAIWRNENPRQDRCERSWS